MVYQVRPDRKKNTVATSKQDDKSQALVIRLNELVDKLESGEGLLRKPKFYWHFLSFLRSKPYLENAEVFKQYATPLLKRRLVVEVNAFLAENDEYWLSQSKSAGTIAITSVERMR